MCGDESRLEPAPIHQRKPAYFNSTLREVPSAA